MTPLLDRRFREHPGGLFEPEVLLPTQHFDSRRQQVTPEKRLMIAVLADAVSRFHKYDFARSGGAQRAVDEAEAWLMSTDRAWPFSCENICEVLGINSDNLRSSLRRWRR